MPIDRCGEERLHRKGLDHPWGALLTSPTHLAHQAHRCVGEEELLTLLTQVAATSEWEHEQLPGYSEKQSRLDRHLQHNPQPSFAPLGVTQRQHQALMSMAWQQLSNITTDLHEWLEISSRCAHTSHFKLMEERNLLFIRSTDRLDRLSSDQRLGPDQRPTKERNRCLDRHLILIGVRRRENTDREDLF